MSSSDDDDDEEEEEESGFGIIETNAFSNRINLNLVEWCPVYDLVSVVFKEDDTVAIYRIPGGHKVFETKFSQECKSSVAQVAWRSDGKTITVALQNGFMRSFSVDNGKLENVVVAGPAPSMTSGLVYWAEVKPLQDTNHVPPDDNCRRILSKFPRVPPVAAGAGSTVVLSDTGAGGNESASHILLAVDSGSHLRIYLLGELFLGSVATAATSQEEIALQKACILSSDCSLQCIITKTANETISVMPINLRFIPKTGPYLEIVGNGLVQTRELLVYMGAALKCIGSELDSLRKASRGISEPLEQATSQELNIDACSVLYELLMTGSAEQVVRDWFSNHINDKVLKKWRKVATTCYEQVRKHIWELVLPATQRLIVILSSLEGLALWPQRGGPLGLDSKQIGQMADEIELILRVCYEMLGEINKEYTHFTEFYNWVRCQFDDNNNNDDGESGNNASNTVVDVGKVAYYLTEYFSVQIDNETSNWQRLNKIVKSVQESAHLVEKGPFKAMIDEVIIGERVVILEQGQDAIITTTSTSGSILVVAVAIGSEVYIIELDTRVDREKRKSLIINQDEIRGAARFEAEKSIVGVEFINDGKVLLLVNGDNGGSAIISFEYPSHMRRVPTVPGTTVLMESIVKQVEKKIISPIQSREFPESIFKKMIVNPRVSRRVGCLIGDDLRNYIVFDLDGFEENEDQDLDLDQDDDDILNMPIDQVLAMAI